MLRDTPAISSDFLSKAFHRHAYYYESFYVILDVNNLVQMSFHLSM